MLIRVAFHIHSNWSYDGHWSIPELVRFFRPRGYQAILLTEHDRGFDEQRRQAHRRVCLDHSTGDFLVIPGMEYSDAANRVHLLTFGDGCFLGENLTSTEVLHQIHARGGASVFAHPSRKDAWAEFLPEWRQFLSGIELWNRKTDGWAPSQKAQELLSTTRLPAFCGLDFHRLNQYFPLAMRIDLGQLPLGEQELVSAIRSGAVTGEAFGHRVERCLQGPFRTMLNASEKVRRLLACSLRTVKSGFGR